MLQRIFALVVALFVLVTCGLTSANSQTADPIMTSIALPFIQTVRATALPPTRVPIATALPSATALPTMIPSPTPIPAWRFVVLGDTRTSGFDPPQVTTDIVEQAMAASPELTLALGDLILSMDNRADVDMQWQNWKAVVEPLGADATVPDWLLVTPGNHDVEGASWAIDHMAKAFPDLPTNGPADLRHLAYSKDYRNVRFISLVSERYNAWHQIDDQLDWLESQLKNNPQPYTIVFSHDPAYPVGPHIDSALDAYPQDRDRLWALLKKYKVTAYIAGHEHLYNRSTHDGVTQLIIGTSGSNIYTGAGGAFYHYAVAEVSSESITIVIYNQKGSEQDRFVLP